MRFRLKKGQISKIRNKIVSIIGAYKADKMQTVADEHAVFRMIDAELARWTQESRLVYEVVVPIVDGVVSGLRTKSGRKAKTAAASRVSLKARLFGAVREIVGATAGYGFVTA